MKCLNLHCHTVTIGSYKNDEWFIEAELKKSKFITLMDKSLLYVIQCKNCNQIYSDYKSKFFIASKEGSLFYTSCFGGKHQYNEVVIFEFVQFDDYIVIGTKNEIISYICREYYSMKKQMQRLSTTNAINENSIRNIRSNLNQEKSEKEKLKNELDDIKTQKDVLSKDLKKEKSLTSELSSDKEKLNAKQINLQNELKNLNITLNSEKDKNKQLKYKLDDIANKNNENVSKVLDQLNEEKKINQDLKLKYSELEEQEKIKTEDNKELEKQLQKKDEILKNYKNFGLNFQSDCTKGEYDIILDINSIVGLIKEGWNIFYNQNKGKEIYSHKKDEKTVVVGVIGNKNMGKTFFLEKLSGYNIPKGFNVKTKGLSVRYGSTPKQSVAILDSAGQETPLLKMDASKIQEDEKIETESEGFKNEKYKKVSEDENDEKSEQKGKIESETKITNNDKDENNNEFEKYSRDKLITEFFLQKFIIWKSNIIILVVGNISLTEQKLLYTLKEEVKNLDIDKQIFVIHNLKEYSTEEQVNDYIENTLKKLCQIKLEEEPLLNLSEKDNNDNTSFNKFFVEEGGKVSHFIFVNEFSEKKKYYNYPTIKHIQKEIEVIKTRNKFSVIEDCKEFLEQIAEDIMEESIKKESLITIEGKEYDKIILKGIDEINLKSYVINEIGFTSRNDTNDPKHSCFIDKAANKLFVNIELPGGGKPHKDLNVEGNFYLFTYFGEKYGDKAIEEDEKSGTKKLKKIVNKRESMKYKFHIKIPCAEILVKVEEGKSLRKAGKIVNKDKSKDLKGVLTYEYDVIVLSQKQIKNEDDDDNYEF